MKRWIHAATTTEKRRALTKSARAYREDAMDVISYLSKDPRSSFALEYDDKCVLVLDNVLYYYPASRGGRAIYKAVLDGACDHLGRHSDHPSLIDSIDEAKDLLSIMIKYEGVSIIKDNPSDEYLKDLCRKKLNYDL